MTLAPPKKPGFWIAFPYQYGRTDLSWPTRLSAPARLPSRGTSFTTANGSSASCPPVPNCGAKRACREREFDHSPLIKALLESGYAWEQTAAGAARRPTCSWRRVRAPATRGVSTGGRRSNCSARRRRGSLIYQPTLRLPPAFYDRYGIDSALVTISDNHPDLICVQAGDDGRRRLRLTDLKRGESLQMTHRVQVLLYALELDAVLHQEGIEDAQADLDTGGVWLGSQPAPTEFRAGGPAAARGELLAARPGPHSADGGRRGPLACALPLRMVRVLPALLEPDAAVGRPVAAVAADAVGQAVPDRTGRRADDGRTGRVPGAARGRRVAEPLRVAGRLAAAARNQVAALRAGPAATARRGVALAVARGEHRGVPDPAAGTAGRVDLSGRPVRHGAEGSAARRCSPTRSARRCSTAAGHGRWSWSPSGRTPSTASGGAGCICCTR